MRQLKRSTDYCIKDKELDEPILCPIRGTKQSCIALCAFYVEIISHHLVEGTKRIVHCNYTDRDIGGI